MVTRRNVVLLVLGMLVVVLASLTYTARPRRYVKPTTATVESFERVQVGMSVASVEKLMGQSSGLLVGSSIASLAGGKTCRVTPASVSYYYRPGDDSFFIYLDSTGKVMCKERRHFYLTVD